MSDVVKVLEGARERVSRGWTQGHDSDADPRTGERRVCAWYAIASVAFDMSASPEPAGLAFKRANRIERVPSWNDDKRRTHRSVLRAFDRAIVAERRRG